MESAGEPSRFATSTARNAGEKRQGLDIGRAKVHQPKTNTSKNRQWYSFPALEADHVCHNQSRKVVDNLSVTQISVEEKTIDCEAMSGFISRKPFRRTLCRKLLTENPGDGIVLPGWLDLARLDRAWCARTCTRASDGKD